MGYELLHVADVRVLAILAITGYRAGLFRGRTDRSRSRGLGALQLGLLLLGRLGLGLNRGVLNSSGGHFGYVGWGIREGEA